VSNKYEDDIVKIRTKIEFLESLREADEIAKFFQIHGIKGVVVEACECPVSRYLKQGVSSEVIVASSSIGTSVSTKADPDGVAAYEYTLATFDRDPTSPVYKFIRNFDGEKYPSLMDE
jgi:hypothetical protein